MTVPARACLGGLRPSFGEPPGAPPLPPSLSCPARRPSPPPLSLLPRPAPPTSHCPPPHHIAPLLHPAGSSLCCRHRLRPPARPRPATCTSALPTAPAERGRGGIASDRPGPPYNLSSPPAPPAPHPPQLGLHRRLDLPAARRDAALPPKQTVFVGARLGAGAARQAAPPRTGCPNGRVRLYRRPTRAVYHVQEQ